MIPETHYTYRLTYKTMWFIAKGLQAIGLIEVLFGLYLGFSQDNLSAEFKFAMLGVTIFGVGWFIEKRIKS
ncbi:MAG: hypothetical protein ACE5JB_09350 [bacterium]